MHLEQFDEFYLTPDKNLWTGLVSSYHDLNWYSGDLNTKTNWNPNANKSGIQMVGIQIPTVQLT